MAGEEGAAADQQPQFIPLFEEKSTFLNLYLNHHNGFIAHFDLL